MIPSSKLHIFQHCRSRAGIITRSPFQNWDSSIYPGKTVAIVIYSEDLASTRTDTRTGTRTDDAHPLDEDVAPRCQRRKSSSSSCHTAITSSQDENGVVLAHAYLCTVGTGTGTDLGSFGDRKRFTCGDDQTILRFSAASQIILSSKVKMKAKATVSDIKTVDVDSTMSMSVDAREQLVLELLQHSLGNVKIEDPAFLITPEELKLDEPLEETFQTYRTGKKLH